MPERPEPSYSSLETKIPDLCVTPTFSLSRQSFSAYPSLLVLCIQSYKINSLLSSTQSESCWCLNLLLKARWFIIFCPLAQKRLPLRKRWFWLFGRRYLNVGQDVRFMFSSFQMYFISFYIYTRRTWRSVSLGCIINIVYVIQWYFGSAFLPVILDHWQMRHFCLIIWHSSTTETFLLT